MIKKLNNLITSSIQQSIEVKSVLLEKHQPEILSCGQKIAEQVGKGNKVLFCGNGGSAADAQHLAAEFVIRYRASVERPALPAISLSVDPSIMTAGGNDIGFDNIYAREVEAYGRNGDVLIGISTSGNSPNVLNAIHQAKKQGMVVIGLLGGNGGKIAEHCDFSVIVPSKVTARIQESHIMIGHIWCEILEEILYLS